MFTSARAQSAAVFCTNGTALHGYDVVAFFTDSSAVKGDLSHLVHWQGADWLFSSDAHATAFKANPENYAPQYGGYCAYGTADGHKAPTEIDTWKIFDGKLYFNYNKKVQQLWLKDRKHLVETADLKWPEIKDRE